MTIEFPTRAERTGSQPHSEGLENAWPAFAYHDPVINEFFGRAFEEYPQFQFYAWDDEQELVIGAGNTIPVAWDRDPESLPDRGIDAALESAFADDAAEPTVLCALQIVLDPEFRSQGLSIRMIRRMGEIGRDHGLETLIAPVRPNLKHAYPLAPIERYVTWRREDGELLDPWLRTHERLGAEIVKIAPESMRIPAPVAQWEEWTEMSFPESGSYVVPGALVPVEIDRERDEGLYVEPNVWMIHPRS